MIFALLWLTLRKETNYYGGGSNRKMEMLRKVFLLRIQMGFYLKDAEDYCVLRIGEYNTQS